MLSGFAEMGLAVRRNFRLVGFDDLEECAQAYPTLTLLHCDIAGFGAGVAATIVVWLEDAFCHHHGAYLGLEGVRASSGGPG